MKVALCISGHARNIEKNIDAINQFVISKFEQVDIFCHLWDTKGWRIEGNDIHVGENSFKGFDYYSEKCDINRIVELLNPKQIVVEKYTNVENYVCKKSVPNKTRLRVPFDRPENTVSLSYKIYKCNELKKEYENLNDFKYDMVIRFRPDTLILDEIFNQEYNLNYLYTPYECSYDIASDIFAFSNSENMDVYSKLHFHLDDIFNEGCLMNGHNIYKHYFDKFFSNRWFMNSFPIILNRQQ